MRFTKRKNKNYSGRMRLPNSYTISVDGEKMGTIQCGDGCWFWYGLGHNTLNRVASIDFWRTFQTPDAALEDFKKFYKEN